MRLSISLGGIALAAILAVGCGSVQTAQSIQNEQSTQNSPTPKLVAPDRVALAPVEAHPNERVCCITYREIIFNENATDIGTSGMRTVTEVAAYMMQNPRLELRVYGSRSSASSEPISKDLSHRRALAVRDALVQAGMPAYRIRTGAFGDPDPQLVLNRPIDVAAGRRNLEVAIKP